MPLSAGDKLGPYEIMAPIGAGGMGEVYRAHDPRLRRDVAIKVSAQQFSDRFEREARAIAALNHPNICQVYDLGPNYLVMEFIGGTPLAGPFPLDLALRQAVQIADALSAAHAKGITHRDLKPANILVTATGIKLLDFGLALLSDDARQRAPTEATATMGMTIAGTILGTAAYMSPEQAEAKPVDARSDIFSFGLVLYEMLSGHRAFTGDSAIAIMYAIVNNDPERLEVAPALQSIVGRCLRKSPADRFQSITQVKDALLAATSEVSSASGALSALQTQSSSVERSPSIAVLPFANMGSDKENEYFSDGLAEEILNALTQLPGLRVIARTSAFRFRGDQDLRKVGEALKVGLVLEGSVRRAGNRIRVSAQLINAADESRLWSDRYDRELRDVFDIQDEIAQAIVEKLKLKLGTKAGPLVKRYTENLEAHSLYLKGNFHLYRSTFEDWEKGRAYLEKAVALDSGYAPAWVQLADYHVKRSVIAVAPPREELPKALDAARKAIAADGTLAEGHAALGVCEAFGAYHWEQALTCLDAALRLNPASPRSRFWHGIVLCGLRRVEESLVEMRRAVELDPLDTLFHAYLANLYIWSGHYDRAADHGRQALEINPCFGLGMATLGEAYSHLGKFEEGITLLQNARQILPGDSWPTAFLGCAYVRAGRQSDAKRLLAELEEKGQQRYVSSATLAVVASAAGDMDRSFWHLDTAVQEHDPNLTLLAPSPQFQPLRADPRYQDILSRMNLAG